MGTTTAPAREKTAYRVRAESVEACSCAHGCNCQFGGTPNEGYCEFVIGYETLAQALLAAGRSDEAERAAERAAELHAAFDAEEDEVEP